LVYQFFRSQDIIALHNWFPMLWKNFNRLTELCCTSKSGY